MHLLSANNYPIHPFVSLLILDLKEEKNERNKKTPQTLVYSTLLDLKLCTEYGLNVQNLHNFNLRVFTSKQGELFQYSVCFNHLYNKLEPRC